MQKALKIVQTSNHDPHVTNEDKQIPQVNNNIQALLDLPEALE